MQIDVAAVEAHVSRPGYTHQRVEVGPVHVAEAAGGVDYGGYLGDPRLEYAQGVGICEHEGRGGGAGLRPQVVEVYLAVLAGLHAHGLQAGKRAAGRVGPVGGVGHQNLHPAVLAVVLEPAPDEQEPCELSLRACGGLERDSGESGDLAQEPAQLVHHPQHTLRQGFRD